MSSNLGQTNPFVFPPPESKFQHIDPGPRKSVFDFYKDGPNPLWGITVRLDVTYARRYCQQHSKSYLHASLFLFSLTANQYPPMRHRIRTDDKTGAKYLICNDQVHPSVTIMRRDGSDTYGFCFLRAAGTFTEFDAYATSAIQQFHAHSQGGLDGNPRDDMLHGSVLPWLDFTQYEHAAGRLTMPSIPKHTWGKLVTDNATGRTAQSLALHVHHGIMDGLHVGRFLEKLQDNFDQAETLLAT